MFSSKPGKNLRICECILTTIETHPELCHIPPNPDLRSGAKHEGHLMTLLPTSLRSAGLCALLTAQVISAQMILVQPAQAGVIERACRNSDRSAASPALCRCIQKVANVQLTSSERKTVSKWFGDPHQAQVVRQSSNHRDEQLWERYKLFGDTAAKTCG
ncbi:hypothetical protein MED193_20629 [Roseobacter sp. MED193]|nr:hypothetical protein MED193_20629 [Roseobacter sp. MED193]